MKSPRELRLPFDEWRPGQQLAIRTVLSSKTRHTVIQSPTGSGKSTIAAALSRLDRQRHIVLTASKGLQDQYSRTFPHLYDIRGMANYECLAAQDELREFFPFLRDGRTVSCEDGPCRSGVKCSLKEAGCTYFDRYRSALAAQAPSTNYQYLLAMRIYSKGLGVARRLVLDEAHALPEELMSAFRIEIPMAMLDGPPVAYPWGADGQVQPKPFVRAIQHWREWAARKVDELKPREGEDDQRVRKSQIVEKLERLTKIDHTWAWDILDTRIVFEPTIPKLLMPLLGNEGAAKSLVYLSATITPATLSLLDIDPKDITYKVMKSRFPIARRPIYLVEGGRIDNKITSEGVAYWLSKIDAIISKRLDRKGIIHTVSYQRAFDILSGSKHNGIMVAPRSASELAAAVQRFRRAKPPMILLSPSLMTGWDFPYTDAEYQIIAKMPFPDTRSTIARARIAATAGYRDHLTMQSLVQAAGRVMRAADDQGETFIVDEHAKWAIPAMSHLAPDWFLEAIERPTRTPLPPSPLQRESGSERFKR